MVPTVQPPPSVESTNTKINMKAPLEDLVNKLHVLIYKIPLPKAKMAKTAAITIKSLHLMCDLVGSASTQTKEPHKCPSLDDISRQLEAIQTHLDTNGIPLKPQKLSYAATLAADTKSTPSAPATTSKPRTIPIPHPTPYPAPRPPKRFSLTLSQKTKGGPALPGLSNIELACKILDAIQEADCCWMEERPIMPDSEGHKRVKWAQRTS